MVARQGRVRRRADDDGAWKRVLGELLREFVAFALPGLHLEVDWSRAPVFLEQELRPILRQAALGRRVGDLRRPPRARTKARSSSSSSKARATSSLPPRSQKSATTA